MIKYRAFSIITVLALFGVTIPHAEAIQDPSVDEHEWVGYDTGSDPELMAAQAGLYADLDNTGSYSDNNGDWYSEDARNGFDVTVQIAGESYSVLNVFGYGDGSSVGWKIKVGGSYYAGDSSGGSMGWEGDENWDLFESPDLPIPYTCGWIYAVFYLNFEVDANWEMSIGYDGLGLHGGFGGSLSVGVDIVAGLDDYNVTLNINGKLIRVGVDGNIQLRPNIASASVSIPVKALELSVSVEFWWGCSDEPWASVTLGSIGPYAAYTIPLMNFCTANVTDVVAMVNYILGDGDYPEGFDLDGNGDINITDIVLLVNIILGESPSSAPGNTIDPNLAQTLIEIGVPTRMVKGLFNAYKPAKNAYRPGTTARGFTHVKRQNSTGFKR